MIYSTKVPKRGKYPMSKKLHDLFNLKDMESTESVGEYVVEITNKSEEQIQILDGTIDKIDSALPIQNLDDGDKELDELSDLAKQRSSELFDLGMNVDPRYAGTILQTASMMMGYAIDAKKSKMDLKLKMVDLQLKKAKLDQTSKKPDTMIEDDPKLDRNEILAQLIAKAVDQKSKNK